MIRLGKKLHEKLGITHFGLMGHEIAVLKSMMESAPDLAADYELREPNRAGTCDIVLVNQDSQLAKSWWKNYKKLNPAAVPLFLTDSKNALDDRVYCKRPFSPSVMRAAVQDLVSENRPQSTNNGDVQPWAERADHASFNSPFNPKLLLKT